MDDHHDEEDSSDMVHDMDFMDSEPTPKEQQVVSDRWQGSLMDNMESGVFMMVANPGILQQK